MAILVLDVVGFSLMMAHDETHALAKWRAIRNEIVDPVLSEQRGRIFKETGDGVLVDFPSAVEAVRAAIGIQQQMRARNAQLLEGGRIEVRIGVHQGDVVVAGSDLLGDGVNIATRLEGLAEPGGICISARVHEDVAGKIAIDAEDLGERDLKNIPKPVRVFRVKIDSPGMTSLSDAAPTKARTTMPKYLKASMAAFLLAVFVIGAVRYFMPSPSTSLFIRCETVGMPTKWPPEGRIYVLSLWPVPAEMGGGGLLVFSPNKSGDPQWPPALSYRCEVVNDHTVPVIDVSMALHLTFRAAIPDVDQPNVERTGPVTLSRDWPIQIDRLEPGADKAFIFYAYNQSQQFVEVDFPAMATGTNLGGEKLSLRILKPSGLPMIFSPDISSGRPPPGQPSRPP